MKIIEPSYEILQCPDGEQCLAFLERCARTCYKSESRIDSGKEQCITCGGKAGILRQDGKTEILVREQPILITRVCPACDGTGLGPLTHEPSSHKLIRHVLDRGHESVIEHMVVTVKFIVDRGVSHELVRHRLASFSQESTRYVRYTAGGEEGQELTFILPCFGWVEGSTLDRDWRFMMAQAEFTYLRMLGAGAKPEEARSILPNSLKTEIVCTANLREWRHILKLRTSPKAHPQIRQVMIPLLAELKSKVPVIFDDLGA